MVSLGCKVLLKIAMYLYYCLKFDEGMIHCPLKRLLESMCLFHLWNLEEEG